MRIRVTGEMWWWRVAYLGADGQVIAVDAATGTLLWRKDIREHVSTQQARFSVYVQADGVIAPKRAAVADDEGPHPRRTSCSTWPPGSSTCTRNGVRASSKE